MSISVIWTIAYLYGGKKEVEPLYRTTHKNEFQADERLKGERQNDKTFKG